MDKKKILIIEDDLAVIDLVKLILKKRDDLEALAAMGGQEGLDLIEQEKPDLVLLDLMMPGMSGWEVYQEMKADDDMRNIPVIVVTAKDQNFDKVISLHIAKVKDHITKPFSPDDLLASIDKVFDAGD